MQAAASFGWKRANHVRATVVSLFLYSQHYKQLPLDRKTAAEIIEVLPNWHKRLINIWRETAKVRDEPRFVPIPENLFAWLEPWQTSTGVVCPLPQPSDYETSRLSKITGSEIDGRWVHLKWRLNALRHTFISAMLGWKDAKGH